MVGLTPDNLGCPSGEGLDPLPEPLVLPAALDRLSPPAPRVPVGQAAFFRLIRSEFLQNLRVEHNLIGPLVVRGNDPLVYPDHVGRHAHAAVSVVSRRLQRIRGDGKSSGATDATFRVRNASFLQISQITSSSPFLRDRVTSEKLQSSVSLARNIIREEGISKRKILGTLGIPRRWS